jgi:hypothetical protein
LDPSSDLNGAGNYQRGYDYGFEEAKKFKGMIKYYEASNELDNWTGMLGDGAYRIQYNPLRYPLAREFIRGLVDGVRTADPNAQLIVDDAGWCHYGFLKALWEDGIRWDITAVHWYEKQGDIERAGCRNANIAAIHAGFGKPIWITEFNSDLAAETNDPTKAAKWLTSFMNQITQIAPKYNIQAAFVYELLDEPNAQGAERYFGIADEKGNPKEPWYAIKRLFVDDALSHSPAKP